MVEQHVRHSIELAGAPSPLRTMPPADVLAATWARVVPTDPTTRHGRPLTGDLSAVLALDLPDSVRFLDDADVQMAGANDLWRAGYANLRSLRAEHPDSVTDGGATIQVLVDDSFFTASQVLVFGELLDRLGYRPDPARGVFVSLPSRHELHFHVLSDPSCIPALSFMARFSAIRFQNSEGPLSPAVHWWRPGALTAASRVDADGVQVVVDGDLMEVMDGLMA